MSLRFVAYNGQYLWTDAEHAQRRRHIDAGRYADVAKVNGERLAPDAKVTNLEDGQIAGQRQHNRLLFVAHQRILPSVLVGNAQPIGSGSLTVAHPELGVCKQTKRIASQADRSLHIAGVIAHLVPRRHN